MMTAEPAVSSDAVTLQGEHTAPLRSGTTSAAPLKGRALWVARAAWAVIVTLSLALFVGALPARIEVLLHPTADTLSLLNAVGLPVSAYALLISLREVIFVVSFTAIGMFIFWRKSNSGAAIFTSIVMVAFAAAFFAIYRVVYIDLSPALYTLSRFVLIIGFGGAPILIYTFPDGRFVPRWTRYTAIAWVLIILAQFPTHEGLFVYIDGVRRVLPSTLAIYAAGMLIAIYAQYYRYRHYADLTGRQQTKWVVAGFATGILAMVLWYTSLLIFPLANGSPQVQIIRLLVGETAYLFSFIAIPLSIAFSILRYRLFEIQFILSRGLIYGALSAVLGFVFLITLFALKALLETLLGGSQNTFAAIAATAVVMALFAPTRRRIQRFIDVRFFRVPAADVRAEIEMPATVGGVGLLTGRQFGACRLDRIIARGGMGEVYHGTHLALRREVAVKVLPVDSAADPELRARFEREARVIAGIRHPNIVSVFDFGEADDLLYMTMEYLDGEVLSRRIKRGMPDLPQALKVLRDVAAALDDAHGRGLVHRDVKPSNIMLLKADGRAVLMDFGIAKVAQEGSGITHTGMLGTVDYIAPEQILDARDVDFRADIYALGVIAYQLLTGRLPYDAGSPGQTLYAHLQQTPIDPRLARPELRPALAEALLTALQKKPDARPASAGAYVDRLLAAAGPDALMPTPSTAGNTSGGTSTPSGR